MILTPESKRALERAVEASRDNSPITLLDTPMQSTFSWTGLTLTQYGEDYPAWIDFFHRPDLVTCLAILHDFDGTPLESAVSISPQSCFKLLQRKCRARKMSLKKESK